LREYFNEVKNIGDKTIWKAIKFSKERSKNFYLGSIFEYLNLKNQKNEKEFNIDKFKLKFNKKYEKFDLYNKIPERFFSYLNL
tara:strand:+ start:41 stop:289 length:249 start_codon:yes stop_codon:yes gene_type:complete